MASSQKTAIVTGASRGFGAGLVEAFLKRGYNVVAKLATHYQGKSIAAVFESCPWSMETSAIEAPPRRSWTLRLEVCRIDVLINNAGVFIPEPFTELHH